MKVRLRPSKAIPFAAIGAAVVLGAGCGGSDEDDPTALVTSTPTEATAPASTTPAKKPDKSKPAGKKKKLTKAEQDEQIKKATATFLNRLPPDRRKQTVTQIVNIALKTFGFKGAKVAVGTSGRQVTITIPTSQACKAGPRDPELLGKRVRTVTPIVNVIAVVASDGTPLDQYISAHCKEAFTLPGGNGPTVFKQTGEGFLQGTTRTFRVRSRQWSIDYRNDGQFLSVIVLKGNGKAAPYAVGASKRGKGTKKIGAGPGTYKLRIVGSSGWTVRVRDGV